MTPVLDSDLTSRLTELRANGSQAAIEEATRLERDAEAARLEELRAESPDHQPSGLAVDHNSSERDRLEKAAADLEAADSGGAGPAAFASESAEQAAADAGLEVEQIPATGKDGKVTVADVRKAAA